MCRSDRTRVARGVSSRLAAVLALCLVAIAGCDAISGGPEQTRSVSVTAVSRTSSAVRAARRAYVEAPPVIPHAPQGASCVACHTPTGRETPPLGIAPANPHGADGRGFAEGDCRQCHVFATTQAKFVATSFTQRSRRPEHGTRQHPAAPPVIPHAIQLRENCQGCHAGPAARPEIRCTHPERVQCRQCHVTNGERDSIR